MQQFSDSLFIKNDIWFSKNKSTIAYPENGNEIYLKIEDASFWYKHRNDCIAISCTHFLEPNSVIIDIGGGNGYVSNRLQKEGYNPILLEPDETGILNAQKRGLKNLICSSFQDADLHANSVPNIGLFDVLEHIDNDMAFLHELHKILKVGGNVVLTVPAYSFLWSDEDDHDKHFRRYTKKELCKKMTQCGYEIAYSTYFFSLLPLPIFILRTIPSFLGYKRSFTQEEYMKENTSNNTMINKVMGKIWKHECNRLTHKAKLLFGGSILIIAKKVQSQN